MEVEDLDTGYFISEVEKRRCIWDMECEDYKSREVKKAAWQEIVDIFAEDDSTLEQRQLLEAALQKRWKSVRDNYCREIKKRNNIKPKSGAWKKTPYKYFKRMQFLERSVTNKNASNFLEADVQFEVELPYDVEQQTSSGPSKESAVVGNKKVKLTPVEKHLVHAVNQSTPFREKEAPDSTNEDEDKLFCLSLYKELIKVPEYLRIGTKIQLLQVIQKDQDYYQP